MFVYTNLNPLNRTTGDCVVRALALLLDQTWDRTYTDLCLTGFIQATIPSNNSVHKAYLEQRGFKMYAVPNDCNFDCINVAEFADTHPYGDYLLCTDGHVVALRDGIYYDIFDSGNEIVNYYFTRKE